MKKIASFTFATGLLVLLAGIALGNQKQTLLLVYEDKPNSNRLLGSGFSIPWEKPGLTIELLLLTARTLDMGIKFQRMPWKRCMYMIQHGVADGMLHVGYDSGREQYAVYPMTGDRPDPSRAIFTQPYHFYVRRGGHVVWDGLELRNLGTKPVGMAMGLSAAEDLEVLGHRCVDFTDQEDALVSLMDGRIGALVGLEGVIDAAIEGNGRRFRNIQKLEPALKTRPYYLAFSRKFFGSNRELAERIWKIMTEMTDSPEFRKQQKRYQ